jgi:hypothetical protein
MAIAIGRFAAVLQKAVLAAPGIAAVNNLFEHLVHGFLPLGYGI